MYRYIFLFFFMLPAGLLSAHPMPASAVKLAVSDNAIKGEAKMPVVELESAIKKPLATLDNKFLRQYFAQHIKAFSGNDNWRTTIGDISFANTQDSTVGSYRQLIVTFGLFRPTPETCGNLLLTMT